MVDLDELAIRRRELRHLYGALLDQVAAILYAADPISQADDDGDNRDEYELEAGLILERLPHCASARDVHRVAYEVFVECLDPQSAGDPTDYAEPAGRIWAEWQRRVGRA